MPIIISIFEVENRFDSIKSAIKKNIVFKTEYMILAICIEVNIFFLVILNPTKNDEYAE